MVASAPDAIDRRRRLGGILATGVVWLAGSTLVAATQPTFDRRITGAAAALAGIGTILVVAWLTTDKNRRFFRSVVGAIVAVSLTTGYLLQRLHVLGPYFGAGGLIERIVLPLLVVLLAPLVVAALARQGVWAQRATLLRSARPLDWIFASYVTVVALPALAVGLHHHNRLLYIGQDLGLIVFFAFMYLVGRTVDADSARALASEFVDLLLLLAVGQLVLPTLVETPPIYSFVEAAAAGALAFALLRPRSARLLPVGIAVVLLGADVVTIRHGVGSTSSTAIELAGALAVLGYLVLRIRPLVPEWLIVAVAIVGIAGFIGLTSDGATLRGQYHGGDQSNLGRTYEARQVRAAVRRSPISLALGRGLGATIDETHAPPAFRKSLVSGGRNLAHVQELHLLDYSFLLKTGFLGLAWLAAFVLGLAVLGLRALERAARERDPSLVIYLSLPLIGFVQALAATSHLPANPLNGLALGILVTCFGAARPESARDD